MSELIKSAKDFGGYWAKNVVNFRGHEGEPLFQCSVYKDGKRIGVMVQDGCGGSDHLQEFSKEDEKELIAFAMKHEESDWGESYSIFVAKIVGEIDRLKYYKRLCKKGCVVVTPELKDGACISFKLPYKGNEVRIKKHLDSKYPKGYMIVNEAI